MGPSYWTWDAKLPKAKAIGALFAIETRWKGHNMAIIRSVEFRSLIR
jgi:hypothetical protein